MAAVAPAPSGRLPGQVVSETLNRTREGWLEHQNRIRRYNRAYEVYRGQVKESRTSQRWQTKLYVKYGMQVIDQAIANMIQGQPKAVCTPRRPEDELAAKAMEVLLGYYSDLDHLAEKEEVVIKQALIYAVSPAKNSWYYKEGEKMTGYTSVVDHETGLASWQPTREKVVESDRPCFTPWDAYDCWWDPYARDVDCASYVVLRDWLTKEELQQRAYNPDTGYGSYRNLDLLFAKGTGEQPNDTSQNRLMNEPNLHKGRFEILEVWRDNQLTVIGNRDVLLYDGQKPFWMGGKPVTIGSSRPDMFRIEGISETELVDHLQQALHMVTNLRMDNLKFTVMRGATYRESAADPTRYVMRPAFLWPVADHGDIEFKDQPALPPEAYQEEETLLGRLQYVTGITPYVTGASGVGVDQNTATGVSLLQESASRLLAFKANQIRMTVWQRTFEQWAALTKQFLTKEQDIRILGPGSVPLWVKLGPQDVFGDYDVRIQAGDESLSRQQERSEAIALLNALAPYAQAGLVNLQPLLEKVAASYDMKDTSVLFPSPQQQQAPPASPGQQAPNAPNPLQLVGGGLGPQPAQALLRGNAR